MEQKLNIIGIIPARMLSKHFPGKPMQDIVGMPMIGHVYNRMRLCKDFSDVYVATCDEEITNYINSIGGKCIYTKESHIGAIDRVCEAVKKIEEQKNTRFDLVTLVQCDEPMVTSDMIGCAISPLIMDQDLQISSLMTEITSDEVFENPNEIKVVVDINNFAMYFSRLPIPALRTGVRGCPQLRLLGIDVFRRDFIDEFNMMFPSPIEVSEGIDLIRVIENGMKVKMTMTEQETISVNTPEDLEIVRNLMKDDYLAQKYIKK